MTQHNICAIATWQTMRQEAHQVSVEQPLIARFLDSSIIGYDNFATAISSYLAAKLASAALPAAAVSDIFERRFRQSKIDQDFEIAIQRHGFVPSSPAS